jgi:hypothetical protein
MVKRVSPFTCGVYFFVCFCKILLVLIIFHLSVSSFKLSSFINILKVFIYFRCEDPMPEPEEVAALLRDFQDDVPLLFAIVLPNTVTFLQFGSVTLPVETFCPT